MFKRLSAAKLRILFHITHHSTVKRVKMTRKICVIWRKSQIKGKNRNKIVFLYSIYSNCCFTEVKSHYIAIIENIINPARAVSPGWILWLRDMGYANPPVLITTVRGFLCRFVEVTAAAVSLPAAAAAPSGGKPPFRVSYILFSYCCFLF